jgi:uncharacterized protein (TIGR03435 family)
MVSFSIAVAIVPLFSQIPAPKPSFEVISIKRTAPGNNIEGFGAVGDRFNVTGGTLRFLLNIYSKANNRPTGDQLQIINAPNWIDTERYDIDAKVDCSVGKPSREQLYLMVQSMLEDRFHLKSHTETRELPIYNLVVAKDGPKTKNSTDQTPTSVEDSGPPPLLCRSIPEPSAVSQVHPSGPRGGAPGTMTPAIPRGRLIVNRNPLTGGLRMFGTAVSFSDFVSQLQYPAGRRVIDKTQLTGLFDFELSFLPEDPMTALGPGGPPVSAPQSSAASESLPSIFTVLQKQLGLKLESAKGPVEVLVIESVQKPTEN